MTPRLSSDRPPLVPRDVAFVSTMPRSGTWFLRYVLAYYDHLLRRLAVFGGRRGLTCAESFDPATCANGPLYQRRAIKPSGYLFIGHTVCPGFAACAAESPRWAELAFHVDGYDYLHTPGHDYGFVPVDGAAWENLPVDVGAFDAAPAGRAGPKVVFVYRNPLDQAVSMYRYSVQHRDPAFSAPRGQPLARMPVREYLFDYSLPSYVKLFSTYQAVAARSSGQVLLITYERLMREPGRAIADALLHCGHPVWRFNPRKLATAIELAAMERMREAERAQGRSLDGSQLPGSAGHLTDGRTGKWRDHLASADREAALRFMRSYGVDCDLFEFGD